MSIIESKTSVSIIESIKEISVFCVISQCNFFLLLSWSEVSFSVNSVSASRPQNSGSDSDGDSDGHPPSPMRPVRPRLRFPAAPAGGSGVKDALPPHPHGPSLAPEPGREGGVPHVFAREEYHSVIRGLGSARALHQGALHEGGALHQGTQSPLTSTPALSSNSRPALVPEEEDLADDWLDDDLGEVVQARKKRRVGAAAGEQSGRSGEGGAWSGEGGAWSDEGGASSEGGRAWTTSTARSQHRQENRGVSQSKSLVPVRVVTDTRHLQQQDF